jgi:hypothetical protein
MLKRLERDAIVADLAAVTSILSKRTRAEDPVGFMQFTRRKARLEQQLAELGQVEPTSAGVALFFGGRPVIGSHGVQVDFGAKALSQFQGIVSSKFASLEGRIGARGPIPQREHTQLIIADVARGSFGFVLQEASTENQLLDTPLKSVLTDAVDLIHRVASPDEETFDEAIAATDTRVLTALGDFFRTLDDAGAVVRVVEESREFTLPRDSVQLARSRTDALQFQESEIAERGSLYVLPESRRFELHPVGGGDNIRGAIDPGCLAWLTGGGDEVRSGIIGTVRAVRLRVREVTARGRPPKRSYTLIRVDEDDAGVRFELPEAGA